MKTSKEEVKDFWNSASCGEDLYLKGENDREAFVSQSRARYSLEPFIIPFADFENSRSKFVLEIGVGLGADHQKFAEAGANLYGIDLTPRSIKNTAKRLELFNLDSKLEVGDAEELSFTDNMFDIVYSWGVVHHSPNTEKAIQEILRVLKENGTAKIMIYHKYSFVGYMLWMRYAVLRFRPFTSLSSIYAKYLESPGTKAYTIRQAKKMFNKFSKVEVRTELSHGDLLSSEAGQRHRGILLTVSRKLFPRYIVKKFFAKHGLFMLIQATK